MFEFLVGVFVMMLFGIFGSGKKNDNTQIRKKDGKFG